MMRFQTVSPECIPLSIGRKPPPRSCKEEDAIGISTDRIPAPPKPDPPVSEEQTGSPTPAKSNGDVLLQWGRKKRARLSRAESRAVSAEDDDYINDDDVPARPVRARRRSTKPRAAAAVTAPYGSYYSRDSNLQPSTPGRDSAPAGGGSHHRVSENRFGNPSHPEKRSSLPPEKPANAFAGDSSMVPELNRERMGDGVATKSSLDQFEWPRIYISLSRKEKEDDFLAMKGAKLPQRPKKRAKNIERSLQYCFPGMWLSDLTRGRYEVRERKCVKKKRQGLKGMESLESDSE